ncbi:hypothetical protein ATK36_4294 [Amycolatopsis sulphurea]|uniref:Circularly permuted ATP-grasp superfamily protein n=1 Tax=Amycolatopsis sulphurea TaxID=76022 RepID=A0A2A9FEI8_9PSEU|nr:hypothetical protein [Amycolatopsis sulphurea]PFG49161.1 hypothetical protein ATK36_4294 [Amycolatopsis sulphurea]
MAHPWFGEHRFIPAGSVGRIRDILRSETRDTGWPYQEYLPGAPFALPRSSYAELFRVGTALLDLLRRTVLAVAPTADARLAALGADRRDHPLFLDNAVLEERYADCFARPDVVVGPKGPIFLGFNVGGGFGGVVEAHCRYRAWRRLYGRSGGSLPFHYHDPFVARADVFADICEELALPFRLAWVGSLREHMEYPDSSRYFDLETAFLSKRGFEARYFEPEDLDEVWDCAPAHRYPLGLRHLNVPDLEILGISVEPVRRALKNGCLLLSTQTAALFGNKVTLGLLSEGRPWLSTAERAVVNHYVPWTRVLADRRTHRDGQDVDLLPFVLRRQHALVLKRGTGSGVVHGQSVTADGWHEAVAAAVGEGGWVVQDLVSAQPYPLPMISDDGNGPSMAKVVPVFGPFLFGRRPGGMLVRFFATGEAGIARVTGRIPFHNVVVTV